MGEKITKNNPDPNFGALAEAIVYLADQIREGCSDVADGLRLNGLRIPPVSAESNQISNPCGPGQGKKTESFALEAGADEIPIMRDDVPLTSFGRKAK